MDQNNCINAIKYDNQKKGTSSINKLILENEEILGDIINAANIGIWKWDIKTGNVIVNERYASIIGHNLDDLTPFSVEIWKELVHEGDRKKIDKYLQNQLQGISEYYDCELRMMHKEQGWIWVHNRGQTIKWSEDRKPEVMLGLIFDITERKEYEVEKLKLTTAIEQTSATVVMTDKDGNIQYGNPAFETISGYSLEEVVGNNPRILQSGLTSDLVFEDMWKTITGGKSWQGELINKRKDGTLYYEEARITPIMDDNGDIANYLAIKQDISQRKYLEEKLKQTARRDSLTNIYNRRYVFKRLSEIIQLYKINGDIFSLAILDIDFFKNVNDKYGHQAGDLVLKELAEILTSSIRSDDILGRYGGEEFIIILHGVNKESSAKIIERILKKVRESKFKYEDKEISITFSCGIAHISEIENQVLSIESLVNKTDMRLYKAKDMGRNRVVID